MSLVSMTATADQAAVEQPAPNARLIRWARPALGLLLPVALAVSWEIAVRLGWSNGRLVPPPSVIFNTFVELARSGELQTHALATLKRVAAGFVCGVTVGTILGAIAGYSALTHRLVDPTLQALRSIPSIAWVPLFILWFGIFEGSKITLISVGVFFPVYLGIMGADLSVDRKIVEVGRVLRLSGVAMVRRILPPAVMPSYVISRAGLGLGWMFVVAAEFLGASTGLGFLLIDGQQPGSPRRSWRPSSRSRSWQDHGLDHQASRRPSCAGKTLRANLEYFDARARPCRQDLSQRSARARRHLDRGRARGDLWSSSAAPAAANRRCCGRFPGSIRRPGKVARRHRDHRPHEAIGHHLPGASPAAVVRGADMSASAWKITRGERRTRVAARSRRRPRRKRAGGRASLPAARPSVAILRALVPRPRVLLDEPFPPRSTPSPAPTCRITCSTCGPTCGRPSSW
jgi:sulfonate transport system permease protein